ncbi:MAG: hypothetical protein JWM18_4199, partial [Chloroflexi bacterium]|nr:hypothetical protein [Chloroflexota bacterium]
MESSLVFQPCLLAHPATAPEVVTQFVETHWWALYCRFVAAMQTTNCPEADRCLEDMRRQASDLRQPRLMWLSLFCEAGRRLMAGQFEEVQHLMHDGLRFAQATGGPDAYLRIQVISTLLGGDERGHQAELVEQVEAVEDQPLARHPAALHGDDVDVLRLHPAAGRRDIA